MHCWECGADWNSEDYKHHTNGNICPVCGADSRNPLYYTFGKEEREDIKENMRDIEWLKNVDLKYFLKEKIIRERKLNQIDAQTKFQYKFLDLCEINRRDEILKKFEEKYGTYDISILDVKFNDVAREIDLFYPLPRDSREQVATYLICLGLKTLAQHRLNELYDAMEHRKDKGINIDYEMKLIKILYLNDFERNFRISCRKLTKEKFEKIKNEKIKEMNEDLDKLRFKIMKELEEGTRTNFTGMYAIVSSSIKLNDYIPCNPIDV